RDGVADQDGDDDADDQDDDRERNDYDFRGAHIFEGCGCFMVHCILLQLCESLRRTAEFLQDDDLALCGLKEAVCLALVLGIDHLCRGTIELRLQQIEPCENLHLITVGYDRLQLAQGVVEADESSL